MVLPPHASVLTEVTEDMSFTDIQSALEKRTWSGSTGSALSLRGPGTLAAALRGIGQILGKSVDHSDVPSFNRPPRPSEMVAELATIFFSAGCMVGWLRRWLPIQVPNGQMLVPRLPARLKRLLYRISREQPYLSGTETIKAELMTGGGWCMYASASFKRLVLGCIKADFCNQVLIVPHIFSR